MPTLGAGGYFFGCVPDGKAIMSTLQPSFPSYKGQLLQILAEWKGTPRPFGSAYSMAIGDTVTQGNAALALNVWGRYAPRNALRHAMQLLRIPQRFRTYKLRCCACWAKQCFRQIHSSERHVY